MDSKKISREEVERFIKLAKEKGYTEEKIKEFLKKRGIEIEKKSPIISLSGGIILIISIILTLVIFLYLNNTNNVSQQTDLSARIEEIDILINNYIENFASKDFNRSQNFNYIKDLWKKCYFLKNIKETYFCLKNYLENKSSFDKREILLFLINLNNNLTYTKISDKELAAFSRDIMNLPISLLYNSCDFINNSYIHKICIELMNSQKVKCSEVLPKEFIKKDNPYYVRCKLLIE